MGVVFLANLSLCEAVTGGDERSTVSTSDDYPLSLNLASLATSQSRRQARRTRKRAGHVLKEHGKHRDWDGNKGAIRHTGRGSASHPDYHVTFLYMASVVVVTSQPHPTTSSITLKSFKAVPESNHDHGSNIRHDVSTCMLECEYLRKRFRHWYYEWKQIDMIR